MAAKRRALMFANMRAGRASHLFFPALSSLQQTDIEVGPVVFELDQSEAAVRMRRAYEEGIRLFIAFGGDGTVGTVVDAMAGTGATLGVIPAGTSNNFARGLGIGLSVGSAVKAIAHGQEISMDVGRANGHYFAHAAIMGLNVDFARRAQLLRRFVGRLSYPLASLMVYRARRLLDVTLEVQGVTHRISTYQVAVLNTGRFGGWLDMELVMGPGANHVLYVLSVDDLRLRTIAKGLPRIFFRRYLGLPGASGFKVKEGRIETENPMPLTLDGEIKTQTPVDIGVVQDGLRVMVPLGRDRP